ncbi:MAG TPA: ABC transporter substrate-binding protein [Verrucomicrobiae bacterium]|nr:ABC transporter substrate-binding protein [Verrucomicrobiae bacterium]
MANTAKKISLFALASTLLIVDCGFGQQRGKIYKIGLLSGGYSSPTHWTARVRQELRQLGYAEGKNLEIEARFSENKLERLPALADELVRLKVDVIVTGGGNDARAAKNATKTIPIVGQGLQNPVVDGLVDSLSRPGGNLTGFTPISGMLIGKRLELLKGCIANLSRVAVMWNRLDPGSQLQWTQSQNAAQELRLRLYSMEVSKADKLESAFTEAIKARSVAVATTASAFISAHQKEIVNLAAKNRLPAIYDRESFVTSGGLISYGADDDEGFRRVAVMVDKILKGAKPGDLPVEQPTKFELVINLKTAKQLGLTIPPNVLARADRVIK